MSKQKLFLDYDDTIISAKKAYCETYNHFYRNNPEFKEAKWWLSEEWNMKDQCPLVTNVENIFASKLFFDYADFMNGNTKEIIENLCDKYDVIIASIGTVDNIYHKSLWLKEDLPCIKQYIMLTNEGCKMNKSTINMQDSIFIDDVKSNLDSSNAKIKICFGDIYDWNRNWNSYRAINWTDVGRLLL